MAEVMKEMWPRPRGCPAPREKQKKWWTQRRRFEEWFSEALLWSTGDRCKESFSPFQVNGQESSGTQSATKWCGEQLQLYPSSCHMCALGKAKAAENAHQRLCHPRTPWNKWRKYLWPWDRISFGICRA